jgi:hypothetical protein
VSRKIEQDKKKVGNIENKEEMVEKMRRILEHAKGLNREQKDQFLQIHERVVGKSREINTEIRKLKIVLFKSMTAPEFDEKKMNVLTGRIKKLYSSKINLMVDGFVEVKKVLGVAAQDFFESDHWTHDHIDYYNDVSTPQNYYLPYQTEGPQ